MRAFHNSRCIDYRSPYGAIAAQTEVTLAIDIWDEPTPRVTLRTWVDGIGETRYQMGQTDLEPNHGTKPAATEDVPLRFSAVVKPESAGIVWYHFIIESSNGNTVRYGAFDGKTGGEGMLRDWEPPSFQLTVCNPRDAAPAWYEPIGSYLGNPNAPKELCEIVETLRENYPPHALEEVFPWGFEGIALKSDNASSDGGNAVTAASGIANEIGTASEHDAPISCAHPLAVGGKFTCFSACEDVFGFWMRDSSKGVACALVNTAPHQPHDVYLPKLAQTATELIDGREVPSIENCDPELLACTAPGVTEAVRIHLREGGSAFVYFTPQHRLGKPLAPGLGVLAHITSLPAAAGSPGFGGTVGAPARAFIDWLARAKAKYWQILPVNPTDDHGSPYAGISAFAGNICLLEGDEATIRQQADALESPEAYQAFCTREASWLDPYSCFMAIRKKLDSNAVWQDWPERYRKYDPAIVEEDAEVAAYAESFKRMQFIFDRQWAEMRSYANDRGIQIIGDIPIYVSADSADVWAHPELFQLDGNGRPRAVAGCPPDAFAEDGQTWGNPLYDWEGMRADGYAWWLRRLERTFALYDLVRLDHFIGFSRYFSIPRGQKASVGTYLPGPGLDFFQAAHDAFGQLPIIAEDLGLITPGVRALGAACGFPGMDIIQFADGNDPIAGYTPRPEKIIYTGTHDNQTLVGYASDRYGTDNGVEFADKLARMVAAYPAPVCIIPLQDILGLDDDARMNTPGTTEGNWIWQADANEVEAALPYARELVKLHEEATARL